MPPWHAAQVRNTGNEDMQVIVAIDNPPFVVRL